MKIIYLKTVTTPLSKAGVAGDERDLPKKLAADLIRDGFAKEKVYVDKRADSKGKRSKD